MPSDRVRKKLRKDRKPETQQAVDMFAQNSDAIGSAAPQPVVDPKAPFNPTPL